MKMVHVMPFIDMLIEYVTGAWLENNIETVPCLVYLSCECCT